MKKLRTFQRLGVFYLLCLLVINIFISSCSFLNVESPSKDVSITAAYWEFEE